MANTGYILNLCKASISTSMVSYHDQHNIAIIIYSKKYNTFLKRLYKIRKIWQFYFQKQRHSDSQAVSGIAAGSHSKNQTQNTDNSGNVFGRKQPCFFISHKPFKQGSLLSEIQLVFKATVLVNKNEATFNFLNKWEKLKFSCFLQTVYRPARHR